MKKIIIIGLLIAVIMMIVTAILIVNENYKQLQENINAQDIEPATKAVPILYEEYHTPVKDSIKGAKFGDSYSTNAISWEKKFYRDNTIAGYYYQLSGLIDKEIENSINERLKLEALNYGKKSYEEILKLKKTEYDYYDFTPYKKFINNKPYKYYDKEFLEATEWRAFFNQSVLSSFSNVISVVTGSFTDNSYESSIFERKLDTYINIDLNTGKDLCFEDLFTSDTDIITMVRNLLYVKLPIQESYTYDEERVEEDDYTYQVNQRYEEVDVEKLEKLINQFKYTENVSFGFTPSSFQIHVGDLLVAKSFVDCNDQIAIFSRFLSDNSLYEDDLLALNGLRAYYPYEVDNAIKLVVSGSIDGVIYNCEVYTMLDTSVEENKTIVDKALVKADDVIRKQVKELKPFKNSSDDIIYYHGSFRIEKATVGIGDYYDGAYAKLDALLDTSKMFYSLNMMSNSNILRFSKKDYDDGLLIKYLSNFNYTKMDWQEYNELDERINISDELAIACGYKYYYDYREGEFANKLYKVEDNECFENSIDYLSYILKDKSEEAISNFLNTSFNCMYDYLIKQNYESQQSAARSIRLDNYDIYNKRITFITYESPDGSYRGGRDIDYIKISDESYGSKPYPIYDSFYF